MLAMKVYWSVHQTWELAEWWWKLGYLGDGVSRKAEKFLAVSYVNFSLKTLQSLDELILKQTQAYGIFLFLSDVCAPNVRWQFLCTPFSGNIKLYSGLFNI